MRGDGVILAIDPGNEQSAYVIFDGRRVVEKAILRNDVMLERVESAGSSANVKACAIEMVASYGMAVGREVFDTCVAIGRFAERWAIASHGDEAHLVVRRDVKMHVCGANNAKDSNIRQALLDRFGPGKEKAIGLKRSPGPLYGVSSDMWAALALAVTFHDKHAAMPRNVIREGR